MSKVCLWKISPYLTFQIELSARSSSLGYGQFPPQQNPSPPLLAGNSAFHRRDWLRAGSTCLAGELERDGFSLWQGRGFKFTVVIGDWLWNWGTSLRNFRINKKPKQPGFPQKASNAQGYMKGRSRSLWQRHQTTAWTLTMASFQMLSCTSFDRLAWMDMLLEDMSLSNTGSHSLSSPRTEERAWDPH